MNQIILVGLAASCARVYCMTELSNPAYPRLVILLNIFPILGCSLFWILSSLQNRSGMMMLICPIMPLFVFWATYSSHDQFGFLYLIPFLIYAFFFCNSLRASMIVFGIVSIVLFLTFLFCDLRPDTHALQLNTLTKAVSFIGGASLNFTTLFCIKRYIWKYDRAFSVKNSNLELVNIDLQQKTNELTHSNLIKDKLFSIISCDLKKPIQRLSRFLSDGDDNEEYFHYLFEQIPQMRDELRITSDWLNSLVIWSQLKIGNLQVRSSVVDVSRIIDKAASLMRGTARQFSVSIVMTATESCSVLTDSDILELVLKNCIAFAINDNVEGGEVFIEGSRVCDGYKIRISHTGKGMDQETVEMLSSGDLIGDGKDIFPGDRGIGVLVSRELIDACIGKFSINSIIGLGTSFSILLKNNPDAQHGWAD